LLCFPVLIYLAANVTRLMTHESYSYMTRIEAWKVLWRVIEKNPLLGLGPANYYYYTANFPILGWYVTFNSHNQYMDILAQSGFVGLAAFAWVLVEIARLAVRLQRKAAHGFANAYSVGTLAGLGGTVAAGMLADWIIPFVYNIGVKGFRSSLLFWFFAGGLLALDRLTARHNTGPQVFGRFVGYQAW
jgi:O-antigen ligase